MTTPFKYQVGLGNVQAATYDYLWIPRTIRGASKYPVILMHGASTVSDYDAVGVAWPAMNKLATVLAREGIPVIAGYMGGNHFGADATVGTSGFMNTALTYVAAQTGCSSSKAHVIGVSMGAGAALRWASLNPSKAASVTGIIPAVSTEHLYTDNPNQLVSNGLPSLIAAALGLTYRSVSDGVTNGTTTLTSATAAFTGADVGRQITRSYNATGGIPVDTTIASVTNSTTVVMDKAATSSASGLSIGIGAPLPMSGSAGYDLIGFHAPVLATNTIPNRWYYASNDPYVYTADVTAAATAAGGTAINTGATGHANATVAYMDTYNGGTDFSDLVAWLKANGA